MICTSIQNKNAEEIAFLLEKCEMAEIRLDRCPLTDEEIEECFVSDVPLVATCRVSEILARNPEAGEFAAAQEAERKLQKAIEAGAHFVDLEIEFPKYAAKRLKQAAKENGTVLIRSYHDFKGTGSKESLKEIIGKCFHYGAEIAKIVTTANTAEDCETITSLYEDYAPGRILAFCMGETGRRTRLECLEKGAPYTYASLSGTEETAPGQWETEEMREKIYGNFKFTGSTGKTADSSADGSRSGRILEMPASKSFAQRAIIAAALAEGTSVLEGYSPCGDTDSAIEAARQLGAEVKVEDGTITVKGTAAGTGTVETDSIHTGESGLLTRLMIPLAAQICSHDTVLTGEKTLLSRPLKGADEMMSSFGVRLESRSDDCRVPLKIIGSLVPGNAEISGRHGSQLVSGLLMALPLSDKFSAVTVHDPKSIPYMFITLDVMEKFGVKVKNEMLGDDAFLESDGNWDLCTEMVFKIKGGQRYRAANFRIEGDWSAAANFLVAGAIFGKAELKGLDTRSLQADLSIMDILMEAGASLSQTDGNEGTVTVQRAPLRSFSIDASNCPDLFPIVAVLAAFCNGKSEIKGTDRLIHKESDRAAAITGMLSQMGVKNEIRDNTMIIEGIPLAARLLLGNLLKGGKYTSCHDHRMVMALRVAALGADSSVIIDDTDCVGKSFPDFQTLFDRL